MTRGINITNYERKVQSFATKTADLIEEIKKGKLSHYHLSKKAIALEQLALELEELGVSGEVAEANSFDIEDFMSINVEAMINLNNVSALRYWKKKFKMPSNEELLKHWLELKKNDEIVKK